MIRNMRSTQNINICYGSAEPVPLTLKCLLHKLLPRDYFEYIEQLREHQDPQTIINIMGGQNIVAPSARSATQSFGRGKSPKKGS